jgi:transcriptional regulator with XRE-family HTH domain
MNTEPRPRPQVDPAWWDDPVLRPRLAMQDIGALYRWLQKHGWTQAQIAAATGQTQPEVSAILGGRQVQAYVVLLRITDGLGIPRGYLGLGSCVRCPDPAEAGSRRAEVKEDDPMYRREFLGAVATVAAGGTTSGVRRLVPAPAGPPAGVPARIGAADVAEVLGTVSRLVTVPYQLGWGAVVDAAYGFSRYADALLGAEQSHATARALRRVLADLHLLIGWAYFDGGHAADARRHQMQALALAREAEEPALVGSVLADLARVSTEHGDPRDAVRLSGLGRLATDSAAVLPAVRGGLYQEEAWALARLSDARGAEEALSRAADEFARTNPADLPDWALWTGTWLYGGTRSSCNARVHAELARHAEFRSLAEAGVADAEAALSAQQGRAGIVMSRISLATCQLLTGERDTGLRTGHQAVDQAAELRSTRVNRLLTGLADATGHYRSHPDAAHLRARIAALA